MCGLHAKKDAYLIQQEVERTRQEMLDMFKSLREQAEVNTREYGGEENSLQVLATDEEILESSEPQGIRRSGGALHRHITNSVARASLVAIPPGNISSSPSHFIFGPEASSDDESEDEIWNAAYAPPTAPPLSLVLPMDDDTSHRLPTSEAHSSHPRVSPASSLDSSDDFWNELNLPPPAVARNPPTQPLHPLPPDSFVRSTRSSISSTTSSSSDNLWSTRLPRPTAPDATSTPLDLPTNSEFPAGNLGSNDDHTKYLKPISFEEPPPAFQAIAGLTLNDDSTQYCTYCMSYPPLHNFVSSGFFHLTYRIRG
ncbi:hypothetical protein P7C70_g1423, partial [Phenoliferia sp. Uapishka_3]